LNLSRGKIFCTSPDWPWGPPGFLYGGYPSSAQVKERVRAVPSPHPIFPHALKAGYGVNFTFTVTDIFMDDQPFSHCVAKTQPFFNPDCDAGNNLSLKRFLAKL
jgi:hypothetical protein